MANSSSTIKAAVLDRPRRSTAGQRLSSLVGKAQEEDETFWSHSIWNEKGGGFADNGRRKKKRRRNNDDDDEGDEDEEESESSSSSEGEGSNDNNDDDSDDDGEGSYRMSEDDSSMAQDQFDSDFDESESDDDEAGENGEMRMGEEECELLAEEKRNAANLKRKKNQRFLSSAVPPLPSTAAAAAAGRQMGKKKGKKGASSSSKRGPMGTGLNEGLVLNWNAPQYPLPARQSLGAGSAMVGLPPLTTSTPSTSTSMPIPPPTTVPTLSQLSELQSMSIPIPPGATTITQPISERPPLSLSDDAHQRSDGILAQPQPIHNLRTSFLSSSSSAIAAPSSSATSVKPPSPTKRQQLKQLIITKQQQHQQSISERKKSQRRQFTQEELILEAVQSTETTNAKWLHARQRSKEEAATLEKSSEKSTKLSNTNHKLVSRFYSRRGCNNTLTFVDMDHLPEFLVRGGGGHHPRRTRASSVTSTNYTSVAGQTTNPSSRPSVGATSTSLEASESTQQQHPPSSQRHPSPNATPERNYEKCIITGKIAKYRDPKSMLGYHDIEAYKELKRKLESGEIVPKINHVQHETEKHASAKGKGGTISTTSRERGGAKAKSAAVATINYFPFAEDQPTMMATITSSSTSSSISKGMDSVKVMVTQQGMPVSPPSTPPQPASRSVELPNNLLEDDRKQPPPPGLILSTEHNGSAETSATPTNDVPLTAPANEVQAATAESVQPLVLSSNPHQTNTLEARVGSIGTITNDSENGKRHEDNGVKPIVTVSNGSDNASKTIPTVREAEIGTISTTATTNTNGGSGANGTTGTREKILAPTTPSAPKICNDTTKSPDGGAADKVIVPDVKASNDKRTTIEAN